MSAEDYYYDFESILHVKYSLFKKKRVKPLHKTYMKEYMTLVKESQTLEEKSQTLEKKMETSDDTGGEQRYELDKICIQLDKLDMQKEELFQALMNNDVIKKNCPKSL